MKVRTAEKRDAIVGAAARLFREHGYDGASMNELVRRMGGSKATIYGYFPSKEALFSAVVRSFATSHLTKAARELVAAVGRKEPVEQCLTQFATGVLEILTSDHTALAVARMVIAESGRSDVGRIFYEAGPQETKTILASVLEEMMRSGELRAFDPVVAADHLLALITAEANRRLYEREPALITSEARQRMVRDAIDLFLHGMAVRPADGSRRA
ncbi:TetR/AcrR family transcriptional regulator [Pseudoxanthomonas sp.]|uniref:TetR/AcrR family transcriptional regulator n=1 Tax=Pseudoxanthomonas sp. TaxID=1871049 RepID=UPI00262172FA|nr:TetR/AcrR family transcriptional regulator [Pseudoxanthomonas sp.]WDS35316.1 MAG: TetR/AcrR family transcriptional regulator [Pseudoxanthomonas sp.]